MSGPVYWLEELKEYEYLIRLDDDSLFTGPVRMDLIDLMKQYRAVYGETLDHNDVKDCYVGAEEFIKSWIGTVNHEAYGMKVQYPFSQSNAKFVDNGLTMTNAIFNCNFEIVQLEFFRSKHYREYWKAIHDSGLISGTRLGDHQIKTMYLDLLTKPDQVICFKGLPYQHGRGERPLTSICRKYPNSHIIL